MSPTIKDVAQKAGVALSTVSLVINRKSNVRQETKKRVENAIAELNYHPRRTARGLASQRTYNLGFILTEDHFSQAEPFYTKIFLGSEIEARKHHYYILLTTVQKNFRQGAPIPRFLLERNVDGVILAGKVSNGLIDFVQGMGLPLVMIDYTTPACKASTVLIDNYGGACAAVNQFIKEGHRDIAFVGGEASHPSLSERLRGYKAALQDQGIPVRDALISNAEPYTGVDDGREATRKLLGTGVPFTAVFASNDTMAVGVMRCLKEKNLTVPRDVSVIGFDDIEVCLQVEPCLSSVRVFKEDLGAIAVRRIVEKIEDDRMMVNRVLVPVELVLRESTARAPQQVIQRIVSG
ncbi:MAG: LacI family transcriptional regulator [Caldithrix sp.]|nr:MAG: LacI family transcriptional regulator [Caldithrix sp.]